VSSPTVLMYHAFGQRDDRTDPHRMFVPVEQFERFRLLTLEEYVAGHHRSSWPRRSVLITIDDGYESTVTEAAPLLARFGIPAVLFALAGRMAGRSDWMNDMPDEPLLSERQLQALPGQGIDVQVHGWDHRSLNGLPADELTRQVADARARLADVMGHAMTSFAYPSGRHDAAARAAVEKAGFSLGFAVHDCLPGSYALRRVDLNSTDNDTSFRLKMSPGYRLATATVGRIGPVRRLGHRLVGSTRSK